MSVNRRYHVISLLPLLIPALHDQFYKLPYKKCFMKSQWIHVVFYSSKLLHTTLLTGYNLLVTCSTTGQSQDATLTAKQLQLCRKLTLNCKTSHSCCSMILALQIKLIVTTSTEANHKADTVEQLAPIYTSLF